MKKTDLFTNINEIKAVNSSIFKAKGARFGKYFFVLLCIALHFLAICGCNESLNIAAAKDSAGSAEQLELRAVKILTEALGNSNPRIRANAIEITAMTKQEQLMPRVQQLLGDDFVPVRFAAALAAGDMQYMPAGKTLHKLLKDPEENVKIAAAFGLYKLGWKQGYNVICEALENKNQTVKANAVVLLGKTNNKEALPLLYKIKDSSKSGHKVIIQAAEAIARLGDERILKKLWALLISYYADDRIVGVKAMGALGTKEAQDALLTMLNDGIIEVRLTAAGQLGMFGYTNGEAEIIKVFEGKILRGMDNESAERVKILAALAAGRIGTEAVTRYLPGLLKDKSKLVQLAAAGAVLLDSKQ